MSEIVRARVEERLVKLYLKTVAQRLDAILSQAARTEPTYLDFLDQILGEETEAKQKKRVAMGIHYPTDNAYYPVICNRPGAAMSPPGGK